MEVRDRNVDVGARAGAIAFDAAGKLVIACEGVKLKTFDGGTGVRQREVSLAAGLRPPAAFTRFARLFAACTERNSVDIFDAVTGESRISLPAPEPPRVLSFSPKGDLLAVGLDYTARIWEVGAGRLLRTVATGLGEAAALAFSHDGALLAVAGFDTDIRVYQAKDGELRGRMEQFLLSMFAAEYSPDGKMLALGGADRSIYLLDAARRRLIRKLDAHPEAIAAVAFSPDGTQILSAGFDETGFAKPSHMRVWDVDSGQALWTVDVPEGVPSVCYSPDGKRFASLRVGGSATIWTIAA